MAEVAGDEIKIVVSLDDKPIGKKIDGLVKKIEKIGDAAEKTGEATREGFKRVEESANDAQDAVEKIATATAKVHPLMDRLADSAMKAGEAFKGKLADGAKTLGKALLKLSVSPLIAPLKAVTGAFSKFGSAVSRLFSKIKSVIMYRAIRSAIRMVTDGFKEGTANAYQWSKAMGGEFASKMDMLATSSLYLKNSLGAMVTPLINAVAPAIDFVVDKFIDLLNIANQVIALLTGASTWTKAIKYPKEYAAAADGAAGSAGKMAKAMTTILAIDELNPLNADNGGGGGGGGGGGSALDYSSMFEEQTFPSSWSEAFEQAWANADFTSIGETIGAKINEALANIPWDKFQSTANNIASSIATFLNGAISGINWNLVGNTVAQGMNTILGFFKTYAEKFDFSAAGAAIGQAISGWANNFNWADFGTTLGLWAKGLLDLLINAIENTDWYAIGSGISEAIKNIDWVDVIQRAFRLVGSLVGAFSAFVEGLLSDFKTAFEEWFDYDTLKDSGTDTWEGFLNGIVEGVKNIGRWIYTNILEPFLTGIKNAFGIHSPSTVMAEQGGYVMDGFLKGLTDGVQAILDFFGGLVGDIAAFFADPIGSIKVAVTGLIDKIPGADKVIQKVSGWISSFKDKIANTKYINYFSAWFTKFKDKITTSKVLNNFTASITKRNDKIAEKNKKLNGFEALITDKSDKLKKSNKNLDGFQALISDKSDKLTKSEKTIDGMTASFNKSQNAMSEEQRRFYTTARFNQSQNALGTPIFNSKANFTDYSATFDRVKMALQITKAYGPNGNTIRLDSMNARGGAYYNGAWHGIDQYATGGLPSHGTIFAAGEAGAEVVGHIGGRTEVLNQSQIASTIAAATAMSNASQNAILGQLLAVGQQMLENQGDIRAYIPAGEVVTGLQRNNRRDGRALVPMGV